MGASPVRSSGARQLLGRHRHECEGINELPEQPWKSGASSAAIEVENNVGFGS
jgi:hypothetical protein